MEKLRTDYISEDDLQELIKRLPWEYRGIIRLAAETGYRINDLCQAKPDAWDKIEQTLTLVEDKTNKVRMVDLTPLAVSVLKEQDEINGVKRKYLIEPLWGDDHKPCNRTTLWRWLHRTWRGMHGKDDSRIISPHSLRKLYAVKRRLSGWSLQDIQADLNHDRMSTTMIYAFADMLVPQSYKPTQDIFAQKSV